MVLRETSAIPASLSILKPMYNWDKCAFEEFSIMHLKRGDMIFSVGLYESGPS